MKCPRCFAKMKDVGCIKVLNPNTNRKHNQRVYRCPKCGYRKLYDFWPLCRSHGDVLKMIADDDQMSDMEKTYCTFQVTKQIYSGSQKPELKTVIESVRGRLGR